MARGRSLRVGSLSNMPAMAMPRMYSRGEPKASFVMTGKNQTLPNVPNSKMPSFTFKQPKMKSSHGKSGNGYAGFSPSGHASYYQASGYKSQGTSGGKHTGMAPISSLSLVSTKPPAHKSLPQFQYGTSYGKPPSRGHTSSSQVCSCFAEVFVGDTSVLTLVLVLLL